MARRKKALMSNEQSFRRLLNFLDPDEQKAGVRYERLRERIIRYCERRRCWEPDLVADRTFVRVEELLDRRPPDDPPIGGEGFIIEVSKHVLSEWWQQARRDQFVPVLDEISDDERGLDWQIYELSKRRLPDSDQTLFDEYHQQVSKGEGKLNDIRAGIAASHGITIGALRVRIHAIKGTLKTYCRCCAKCLEL